MSWTPLVCYTLVHTDCEYREKVPNFAPPEYHPIRPYARGLEPHAALLAGPSKLDASVGACAIARRLLAANMDVYRCLQGSQRARERAGETGRTCE